MRRRHPRTGIAKMGDRGEARIRMRLSRYHPRHRYEPRLPWLMTGIAKMKDRGGARIGMRLSRYHPRHRYERRQPWSMNARISAGVRFRGGRYLSSVSCTSQQVRFQLQLLPRGGRYLSSVSFTSAISQVPVYCSSSKRNSRIARAVTSRILMVLSLNRMGTDFLTVFHCVLLLNFSVS